MRLKGFYRKCTAAVIISAMIFSIGCGKEEITPVIGNVVQESSRHEEPTVKETKGTTVETQNEKTTEEMTEAVTEEVTTEEAVTEAVTEPTTEATAEPETEAHTQPVTKAVTEPTTKAPTEAPYATEISEEATTAASEPTTKAGPGKLTAPFNIAFLGDSITVGYDSDYSYADVVSDNLKAMKYNYGHVGDTLASDGGRGLVERYTYMFDGSEVIVVYGGSNDYYNNVPLGSPDSHNRDDFYGALKMLCAGLKEKYPKSHIIFITPLPGEFYGKHNSGNNETGNSMWDYVDAMQKICAKHNIHVIDLYHNFTINSENYDEYTTDGLHPNEKGHDLIAEELEKYIRSLM